MEQELEAVRVLQHAPDGEVREHRAHVVLVERGLAVVRVQLDARARAGLGDDRRGQQAVRERRERVHRGEQVRERGRRERAPALGVDHDGALHRLEVRARPAGGGGRGGAGGAPGVADPEAHALEHAPHELAVVEVRAPARRGVPHEQAPVLELWRARVSAAAAPRPGTQSASQA